jgi:hypothetical protein
MQTRERLTVESDETRLIAYRSPASRCKDLLLGPPLHDQTGRDVFAALNWLAGVNVAIVHPRPRWPSVRPPQRPLTPPAHEFPASRYARRHPAL